MSLRQLATAKGAGFRSQTITVPEWNNVVVMLVEPSVKAWSDWLDAGAQVESQLNDLPEDEKETKKRQLQLQAEVTFFASILRDENGEPVFTGDLTDLFESYGPVHTRLLNQAIKLAEMTYSPIEDAKKK